MGGYSNYFIALLSSLIFFSSVSTSDRSKLSLKKTVIKADRGSPAFAAIEDLFSLDDLTRSSISGAKKIEKINLHKARPMQLKGATISLNENIDKSSFVKVALLGERIGVKHFTKKFIKPDLKVTKLSNFKQTWGSDLKVVGDKTKNLAINQPDQRSLASASLTKDFEEEETKSKTSLGSDEETVKGVQQLVAAAAPPVTDQPSIKVPAFSRKGLSSKTLRKRKMIRGQLVLKDGAIASGSDFIFYIERLFDGVVFETGVVDTESGIFEIEVESARGLIISELRNTKGDVLAYGELNLSKEKNLDEIKLELYPSGEDFSGRTLSYDESFEDYEKPVRNASQSLIGVEGELDSDQEGYFNEQVFKQGSTFVATSHADDFWSTLSIGANGKPLYPRLYSKEHIKALSQLADPFGEEIEITSLITGRVTQAGLNQTGITLKVFGADYQRPVYFQNKIPNPKLETTSQDGRFAFINLFDGDYLVQAFRGERLLSQRWFKVKKNHVSFGQINLGQKQKLQILVKDFPEKMATPDQIEVAEYGVDLFKVTDNQTADPISLDLQTNPELTVLQTASSENHISQIVLVPSKSIDKVIYKINKNWLESFLAYKKSNANRSMAMIVGLYNNSTPKKVILEASTIKTKDTRVYYFDKFGDSVDEPLSGGGYVITDVPGDLNTLILSDKSNSEFTSKLVFSDNKAISIISN